MARDIRVLYIVVSLAAACSTSQSPPDVAGAQLKREARSERFAGSREARPEPAPPEHAGVELSAEEKARVINDPLHAQARAASTARAAERAATYAARLALAPEEAQRFLAILADSHEAKLSIIEFHKQHRNVSREEFQARLQAGVPASVLARASAASIHKQLQSLLGGERYANYLKLLDGQGDS